MAPVDTVAPAMGSSARLYLVGGPAGLEPRLRARLTALEHRWSRFLADSEVSRINASGGRATEVSTDTVQLVDKALQASRRTRGWFDPTLLYELETAGYDRTFSALETDGVSQLVATLDHRGPSPTISVHDWSVSCRRISVDTRLSTVTVPRDVGFDPGGIGKGLAADLLTATALAAGATSAMVDLGGDIVFAGTAPDGGWPVHIEDPHEPTRPAYTLRLPWGSVATSSRAKRRWHGSNGEAHHLLDPTTGAPSESDVVSCTVIAGPCWLAEAMAKAALVAGSSTAIDLLEAGGVEGLVIDMVGRHHTTANFAGFVSLEAA